MFTITPRKTVDRSCELPPAVSRALQARDRSALEETSIFLGRHAVPFSEVFHVDDNPSGEKTATFRGDLSRVHGLGREWQEGKLLIEGTAGDCVGERMSGGTVQVNGNVRDGAARGMKGGALIVEGDAGRYVGGMLPGSNRGMSGGDVCIRGSVGEYCGYRLRRGTIVVGKEAGLHFGHEMLAGTLVLCGSPPKNIGIGMVRGTILLLGSPSSAEFPRFEKAVRYQPVVLQVLLKYLRQNNYLPESMATYPQSFTRYLGDYSQGERGEIFITA